MDDPTAGSVPGALPYEPTRWITTSVVVLLLVMAMVFAFLIESLRADQYTLSFVTVKLPVSDTEIVQNHQRLVRDSALLVLLGAAVAVLWLVWQYRAHANARALVSGTRFRPLWGVAAWLVPGVNLILPLFAVRELWRVSDPNVEDWRRARTSPLVWLWWLLILAGLALGGWALAPDFTGHDPPVDLLMRDHRGVIAGGIAIVAAVAAAVLFALLQSRMVLKEDRVRLGDWKGWSDR